jgi:hypothetical protein
LPKSGSEFSQILVSHTNQEWKRHIVTLQKPLHSFYMTTPLYLQYYHYKQGAFRDSPWSKEVANVMSSLVSATACKNHSLSINISNILTSMIGFPNLTISPRHTEIGRIAEIRKFQNVQNYTAPAIR